MTTPANEERPVQVDDLPSEEDIDTADVAERVDEEPEDQPLRQDPKYAAGEPDSSD